MPSRLVLVAAAAALGCGGATTMDATADGGADATGDSTSDVTAGGDGSTSDPWSCIGHVAFPTPSASTIRVRYLALDPRSNDGSGVAGIQVRACPSATDSSCAASIDVQTTDATGHCEFMLPTGPRGFDGYFEATATNDITLLNFVRPPLASDRTDYQRIQWTGALLQSLVGTAGYQLDPNRGHIGIEAHNCLSQSLNGMLDVRAITLASGVTFEIDPTDAKTVPVYLHGNAFETNDPKTDASGTAGVVNVIPGVHTLTMKLAATGQRIGSTSVAIRPGVWSMFAFFPSP